MKEIRMDWETYKTELSNKLEIGAHMAIWEITAWIKGSSSLKNLMILLPGEGSLGSDVIKLVKALGREDELKKIGEDDDSSSSKSK